MKLWSSAASAALAASVLAGISQAAYASQEAPLKLDRCALSVSVPHPVAGSKETLVVKSTAGKTSVSVKIQYKTTSHVWKFTTGATSRSASYTFGVGRPAHNYKVVLSGVVTKAPADYKAGATCSTSFTP